MKKYYFEAVHEILTTGHWITDTISKELRKFDIYEPQYNVLRILKNAEGGPVSVNTILEGMIQRSSNITRIVDKLSAKGLVERTLSTEDRRKMDINITAEGIKLLKVLDKKVYKIHKPMMDNLSHEEADMLKHLIIKLKGSQS